MTTKGEPSKIIKRENSFSVCAQQIIFEMLSLLKKIFSFFSKERNLHLCRDKQEVKVINGLALNLLTYFFKIKIIFSRKEDMVAYHG